MRKEGVSKMELYHYRSIESAIKELENGTFHFADRNELNDPIEGYVRVFWQGDKAAWEGMLRNYICSLSGAIDMYLLQGNEDMLYHRTLIIDLKQFDNVPLGGILKKLGDKFLEDEDVQKMVTFYGNYGLKVQNEELRFIFRFIHNKALVLCIQKCREYKTIPAEEANGLLNTFTAEETNFPWELMNVDIEDQNLRIEMAKLVEDIIEDMYDWHFVCLGLEDETFLYGLRKDENGKIIKEDKSSESRQRRKWMTIAVDFPKVYVNQLMDLVYPESYIVCFSGKNNDSAMWGNYADNHRGVCLIYETDAENHMTVKGEMSYTLETKPVSYGGNIIERNFFESFGRLTPKQIEMWLTGTEELSSAYKAFNNVEEWRKEYWAAYEAKTYRKLKAWEYENEYRLALSNTFYNFDKPESRNLKYEPKALKGLIFGINTTEYDKERIMKKLLEHTDEYGDFVFYQAEYDDEKQVVNIRKKSLWKLK